ncbi:MAG: hypothetical protein ACPGVU_25625 [Limisphaerales bacterium]
MKHLTLTSLILSAFCIAAAPKLPPHPLTSPSAYRSPLEAFRKLLDMKPNERTAELAKRSERSAEKLARKLAEYEAMEPGLRELRLQATELRYYLYPMFMHSKEQREIRLQHMPQKFAPLIRVRLEKWDQLPAEMKNDIQKNQWMMHAVLRYGPKFASIALASKLSPSLNRNAEEHIKAWQSLDPQKQRDLMNKFNSFFSLHPGEQEQVIARLPDYQRAKVFTTLGDIQRLPEDSRRECMSALQRFIAMDAKQRMAFFHNAEQWRKLSEVEKKSWRTVVKQFAKPTFSETPPLPPGMGHPIAPIHILTTR